MQEVVFTRFTVSERGKTWRLTSRKVLSSL